MLVLGHRGASADAPENTLSAFRAAADQGADGVELDVQRCASGELVVCHDERLDRLAGLHWEVVRTPWWKLKEVDVGTRLGFAPERIPLLEEVFDVLPRTAWVNVELKGQGVDDGGLARRAGDYVVGAGLEGRVLFSSFNPMLLLRLAAAHPGLARGYLIDPDARFFVQAHLVAPLVSTRSIHPHFGACTAGRVARWHARGFQVVTWTVDDVACARALRDLGVDLVITNRPGVLRRGLSPG